jgi:hypothetical protein
MEILYNEIFDSMDTFIDDYVFSKFEVRYEKLVRQYRNDLIIAINTNIKEGPNKLPNFIERHDGNISDIF